MAKRLIESGIDWMGNIPNDWEISKIKQIGQYVNGYAFKPEDWSDKGKQIIRIQDLSGSNDNPNHYEGELPSKYLIKKGDILISWAATLDAFVWEKEDDGWLNQHIFKAIPNEKKIYFDFFYWLMKITMDNMNNDNKHGIVMQHVTSKVFGNFSVPLPPMKEQKKIADFLDKKCAEIDKFVSDTNASIVDYKKYKKVIISEIITKGLVPDVEFKDSGVEWVGVIPKHWCVANGKNILTLMDRPVWASDDVITCFRDGEVTLRKNRREEGFTFALKEIGYQGIEPGDLVIHGMDGFAGAIGISDSRGKGSPVLNVCDSSQNKRFLMYYLRSMAYNNVFTALATGVRVRSCDLKWNKLAELPYPFPPSIKEQEEIVDYLDTKCAEIDKLIATKEALVEDLKAYKKSLIYEYVTGKKEVI